MVKQLYSVRDKNYKLYHVLATGYDDAANKVKEYIENANQQGTSPLISSDGSLNMCASDEPRFSIELLGDLIK